MKRAALGLGLALCAMDAAAWGSDGHSIIGEIAQRRLGGEARAQVEALLGGGHSLASEGSWADDVRPARPETFNWHFVDIPIADGAYDAGKQCASTPKGDCIVAELERLRAQLRCGHAEARREALRFAVHFVGDVHQPLHTVDEEQGGNGIRVDVEMHGLRCPRCVAKRTQENLHAVWDSTLIANTVWNWGAYASRLESGWLASEEANNAAGGTPQDWAIEAHGVAREIWPLTPGDRLIGDDYYFKVLPALDRQLGRGGLRLARFLDDVFSSSECRAQGSVAAVRRELPAPPAGVTELRFEQVFKLPAGPRGLELTPGFVALDGKSVRIVGYRVRAAAAEDDGFIIAPFPVSLGDDDESLADDLPASALFVRLDEGARVSDAAGASGLLAVIGVLHVMAARAAGGRLLPAHIDVQSGEERPMHSPASPNNSNHALR